MYGSCFIAFRYDSIDLLTGNHSFKSPNNCTLRTMVFNRDLRQFKVGARVIGSQCEGEEQRLFQSVIA